MMLQHILLFWVRLLPFSDNFFLRLFDTKFHAMHFSRISISRQYDWRIKFMLLRENCTFIFLADGKPSEDNSNWAVRQTVIEPEEEVERKSHSNENKKWN